MSEVSSITVELRDRAGKGAARATRRAGKIPAVIYGNKQAPTLIALDPRKIVIEMNKPGFLTRLFDLDLGNGTVERTLVRDVHAHPVTDAPMHVDFLRLGKDSNVTVAVPVHFVNELASPGLKRGGVLNVVRHEVELVCPVDSIPDFLTIDLTGLDINDSVHISAITLPAGVHPTIARDFTIATIAAPTVTPSEGGGA